MSQLSNLVMSASGRAGDSLQKTPFTVEFEDFNPKAGTAGSGPIGARNNSVNRVSEQVI